MSLRFRHLAHLSSFLLFALSGIWMFAPARILSLWGVGFHGSTDLVSRRMAAVYAGVGIMLFLARKAEPSLARSALVSGLIFICSILAGLGLFELATGAASPGILPAVVIEATLALAFLFVARNGRSTNKPSKL